MAKGKIATAPVHIENNKVKVTTPPPTELVVVGDHLEFDNSVNKGVFQGNFN